MVSAAAFRIGSLLSAFGLLVGCGLDREGGGALADAAIGTGASAGMSGLGGSDSVGGGSGSGGELDAAGGDGIAPAGCSPAEQCVPKPPSSWSYAWMAEMGFSPSAPAGETCPDGASPKRWFSEPHASAECKPCTCGALTGATCAAQLLCSNTTGCTNPSSYSKSDGSCQGETGSPTLACQLGPPTITSTGSCAPAGGGLVGNDAWKKLADICDTKPNGSCGGSAECLPRGTGSYAGFICVYSPGAQACPTDYEVRSVVYLKGKDERKCTPCACTPGSATCVGPVYDFYDDALCAGGGKSINSQTCTDVSAHINAFWPAWGYRRASAAVVQGSCTPSGGVASGAVIGDDNAALTVCCRYQAS